MITFPNGGRLLTSVTEFQYLEPLFNADRLYLDYETTSGDQKIMSTNPWHNCDILGVCLLADDQEHSYYLPVKHQFATINTPNLPRDAVANITKQIVQKSRHIIGHNVKYDLHVQRLHLGFEHSSWSVLSDTVVLAKLCYSDLMTYTLDNCCDFFLPPNVKDAIQGKFTFKLKPYTHDHNGKQINKDYGRIPVDVLGEYGCQDVIADRALYRVLSKLLPEDSSDLWRTEQIVTERLYEMEKLGLRIDADKLPQVQLEVVNRLLHVQQGLADLTDTAFRPHVNDDVYDVLCQQMSLPVLTYTNEDDDEKESNPSFDKDTLQKYAALPEVMDSPELSLLIKGIQDYRKHHTFKSLFLDKWDTLHVDGVLHGTFNQIIKTGRMACSDPNLQQLGLLAKKLVIPWEEDHVLIDLDFSQVEFRLICHYIGAQGPIEAYNSDPSTDFHSWIADACGIKRKYAKNLNFAMGFGAGVAKSQEMVMGSMSLDDVPAEIKADGRISSYCKQQAKAMYGDYHRTLPSLRPTSRKAKSLAESRGWVKTLFNRYRHLSGRKCKDAFNSVCQGSAADILKDRIPYVQDYCSSQGLKFHVVVHDSFVISCPKHLVSAVIPDLLRIVQDITPPEGKELSVPIHANAEVSSTCWAEIHKRYKYENDGKILFTDEPKGEDTWATLLK